MIRNEREMVIELAALRAEKSMMEDEIKLLRNSYQGFLDTVYDLHLFGMPTSFYIQL